jgi:hypothetical protein
MEHKLTITLPDEVYQPLVEAALKQGRTPEEVAAEQLSRALPKPRPPQPNGEKGASIREFFGIWDSGDPNFADNERIDADLAREYGATHDEED